MVENALRKRFPSKSCFYTDQGSFLLSMSEACVRIDADRDIKHALRSMAHFGLRERKMRNRDFKETG